MIDRHIWRHLCKSFKKLSLKGIHPIITHGHFYQGGYPSAFAAYKIIHQETEAFDALLIIASQRHTCAEHIQAPTIGCKMNNFKPINVRIALPAH